MCPGRCLGGIFFFSYTMIAGFIAVYIFGYLKYVAPASPTCNAFTSSPLAT